MIKEVILRDTKKSRFVYPDEVAGIYIQMLDFQKEPMDY